MPARFASLRRFFLTTPMVAMFRADPLLLALTVVLAGCTWAPLFATPFLPLQDLPDHIGMISLLSDTAAHKGLPGAHFQVNYAPIPYWTCYLIMWAIRPILGALWTAKFIVGFIGLLIPLSVMRLMVALRRDPRLGLWSFALAWDYSTYFGWISYTLGVALALFTLARLLEAETPKQAIAIWPLAAVLGLTHALSTGILFMLGGLTALVGKPVLRRLTIHALALSASVAVLMPWLVSQLAAPKDLSVAPPPFDFEMHNPTQKLVGLFEYSLDNLPGLKQTWWAAGMLCVLLVGPLLLACLRQRRPVVEDRYAAVIALSMMALYLITPLNVYGPIYHTYTYPRFTLMLIMCVLLVPRPSFAGWRALALAPGVVGVMLYDRLVFQQFAEFGAESRPFLSIIASVRDNASVLPVTFDDMSKASKLSPYNQFHAYIVAVRRGFDPFLFDYPTSPLLYKPVGRPPAHSWNRPGDFSMEKFGRHYDYVLIQGLKADPLIKNPDTHLVKEAGRWRLYAVDKHLSAHARQHSSRKHR